MMTDNSIQIPEYDHCPFCSYLSGEKPFSFVYKGSVVAILVTREQRGCPHLLVIPTRHCETILECTDEETQKLSIAVRDVAKAVEGEYKPAGIAVWQNNGVPASQSIGHVHFHVAGTLGMGGTDWGNVPELPLDETEKIAKKLRPFFRSYKL